MTTNLNVGTYMESKSSTDNQSVDDKLEKYCYDNNESNCTYYGGLYQWAESMGLPSSCNTTDCAGQISTGNHRGICPSGWHIPKASEWESLNTMLNGDMTQFKATLAGYRNYFGEFATIDSDAFFWEPSQFVAGSSYYRVVGSDNKISDEKNDYKTRGYSVRCFKD